MLATRASEFGSTAALSTGVFQALSSGNGRRPCRLALTPRPGVPGVPGEVGMVDDSLGEHAARANKGASKANERE
jgi:hypothetical protein